MDLTHSIRNIFLQHLFKAVRWRSSLALNRAELVHKATSFLFAQYALEEKSWQAQLEAQSEVRKATAYWVARRKAQQQRLGLLDHA